METSTAAHHEALDASQQRFREVLEGFRQAFDEDLFRWLEDKGRELAEEVPEALELSRAIRRLVGGGGKRLRPALIHFTYRACGGGEPREVRPVEMASELLHSYLLIHDDIMDRAEVRRGHPAAHAHFRQMHHTSGWEGDGRHFGDSMGILVGDLAHAWASELVAGVLPGNRHGQAVLHAFSAMGSEVIAGQYLEMLMPFRREPSEEDLLRVLRLKSGRYSVERPIELGAVLAGAPAVTRDALGRFGRAAGEAFQLQDDILGMFGDAATVGKPVGSDLREGKFTFLILHTLRLAAPADRDLLRSSLGREDLSLPQIEASQEVIRSSGGLEAVRRMISERLEEARAALTEAAVSADEMTFFTGFLDYMGAREQ